MISDCPLLDGSITTDRNGISSCLVAKALRTCPCQDSHVSISEWPLGDWATMPRSQEVRFQEWIAGVIGIASQQRRMVDRPPIGEYRHDAAILGRLSTTCARP
jgi:hypothetical protein